MPSQVQPGHEVFVCFEARNDTDCDFDTGMRIFQRRSGLCVCRPARICMYACHAA